ncbi:MAG: selenide, water dikinase SelD, partial [Pseudoflavonifractor sp.]
MGPGVLGKLLARLPKTFDERLMVGFDASDDAAVYRIDDHTAMIQTVDFFPPMVDDPRTFGQIAATNALSDVYAMGGVPRLAMNLLCFPSCLSLEAVGEILAGGADKVMEAGAVTAGGHSIEDKEPKYGLCVTGFAHPDEILTNSGVKPGDVLVLTKALGTGILSTAAKSDLLTAEEYRAMAALMTTLNKTACEVMLPLQPSACTDVTGFGLLGHAAELAAGSGVMLELWANAIPVIPRALA